jgi:hypothetical protein
MGKLRFQRSFGVVSSQVFNHLSASLMSKEVLRKAAAMGMWRVAGNIFECQSQSEFWQVRGNKLVRLVGNEVDNGDHLPAAPSENPEAFMSDILGDLQW